MAKNSGMAYLFRQGDLPKLDLQVNRGTDFKAWKTHWQAYFSLTGLDTQDNEKQVQTLTLCFSWETITIAENLGLTEEQRKSAKEIITVIEAHINGQIESMEWCEFRSCVQQEGELFDDILVSLHELAKTYNFAMMLAHKRTFTTRSSWD